MYQSCCFPKNRGQNYDISEATTSSGQTSSSQCKVIMSCEQCSINFTFFKRKKICMICRRTHCSNCLPKEPNKPSNQRRCGKCKQLSSSLTRADLMKFKAKDLKLYLSGKRVSSVELCTEKNDLVELLLKYNNSAEYWQQEAESRQRTNEMLSNLREGVYTNSTSSEPSSTSGTNTPPTSHRQNDDTSQQNDATPPPPPSSNRPAPSNTTSANSNSFGDFSATRAEELRQRQQREMREAEARLRTEFAQDNTPDPRPAKKRTTLKDVKDEESIEDLSIKQLKEILAANFVDYKGCCEKYELVDRVRRLYKDSNRNKEKVKEIYESEAGSTGDGSGGGASEDDVCKICMDAMIDCVLLECGHMVTCTTCGRRLAECPICRNYVVRVVHTFRA